MNNQAYKLLCLLTFLLCGCLPKQTPINVIEPHCLASQSQCEIQNELGQFEVLFNIESVITEQAFNIIVRSHSPKGSVEVSGYLEGKDMYMGKIPLFFTQDNQQTHTASTMLGSCAEQEMIWRMWITITDKLQPEKAHSHFIDFKSTRF